MQLKTVKTLLVKMTLMRQVAVNSMFNCLSNSDLGSNKPQETERHSL